jgi:hypothetical protein
VAGANKGDNLASVILKANVTYTSLADALFHRSLIMKVPHFQEGFKKDVMDTGIFDTEIKMYTEILPEMQRLLKEADDDVTFGPK